MPLGVEHAAETERGRGDAGKGDSSEEPVSRSRLGALGPRDVHREPADCSAGQGEEAEKDYDEAPTGSGESPVQPESKGGTGHAKGDRRHTVAGLERRDSVLAHGVAHRR